MCLLEEFVNYWYENVLNLVNIKLKKVNFCLFSIDSLIYLKLVMFDSVEEFYVVIYFFEYL